MWICHPISEHVQPGEAHIRGGLDHKELGGRLTVMQQMERGVQLGAEADDSMSLSQVWNAPVYDNTSLMEDP